MPEQLNPIIELAQTTELNDTENKINDLLAQPEFVNSTKKHLEDACLAYINQISVFVESSEIVCTTEISQSRLCEALALLFNLRDKLMELEE